MSSAKPPFQTNILPYGRAALEQAAALIREGRAVAVPTETVYGLAADATSPEAVARIYAAKGRPSFNPLIVHIAGMDMARRIARFSPLAEELAGRFWPGPLTLVLPLQEESGIASLVTAGLPTIALRYPHHEAMQALIRESGRPLAAPSANASGSISPRRAEHVMASLGGRIPLILDAGPTEHGLESTILAPETNSIRLLRPGPVTAEMLTRMMKCPVIGPQGDKIEAPGQLLSHYAPSKRVRLNAKTARKGEYLIGFGDMPCDYNLSESAKLEEAAARLFDALHLADASAAKAIAVAPVPGEGLGVAINDRLKRAAA
ncbi:MAG TPA: L-threonylcarbamoyladenylate synthase [Rhizorhapis sp.]|nr:L-threonylcarbamoyladenylate synthase [Rhizorhapis sp.]